MRRDVSRDAGRSSTRRRWLRVAALAVHVVTAVEAFAAAPWFGDLPDRRHDAVTLRELAASVGNVVLRGAAYTTPAALRNDTEPSIVFISVSDGAAPARVALGRGAGLHAAASNALARLGAARDDIAARWVVVDVVDRFLPAEHRRDGALERPPTIHGLAYPAETMVALLPGELVAHAIIDDRRRIDDDALGRLGERGRRARGREPLGRFTTQAVFTDGADPIVLSRGRPPQLPLTPERLLTAASAAASHLVRQVGTSGRFTYEYDPVTDRASRDYNILRHAGTIYAILEVYEVTREPTLLTAARRAVGRLTRSIVACTDRGEGQRCVRERNETKLGGNGLALVALAKLVEVTGDRALLPTMRALAARIQAVQRPDGSFRPHKTNLATGSDSRFVSEYYPGEAMLGLLRLQRLDPNGGWADVAAKNAAYLIDGRDRGKPLERLPHDHWFLYALDELDQQRPDGRWVAQTERIVDAILSRQRVADERGCCTVPAVGFVASPSEWEGTFYTPPRSTPVATRVEGLGAAFQVMHRHGRTAAAARTRAAMERGVAFCLRTQLRPWRVLYLPDPARIVGAFPQGLTKLNVRIDYSQHAISALLRLRRVRMAQTP